MLNSFFLISAATDGPPRRAATAHRAVHKVDAQCDKLSTVVGRTTLTTLATVEVPWRDGSNSTV